MTQVVGTLYDGSTAATSHTITVPGGVTSGMTGLFVIGTGSSNAATTTLARSGSTFTKLNEQNAANTRVAIWSGTGLSAGNTVTLTLSSSEAVTVAHYYQDDYTFSTLSAAIRSTSVSTTTSGSASPTNGQKVVLVAVERTTTATTVSSVTSSGGETVTQITYGEGTGSAQASCYAGSFIASAGAARTATITYSNASGNGYAALILTTATGGGGGGGGGGAASSPGALLNTGKAAGKNHSNWGLGYTSGHVDITENAIEAGFVEPGMFELNSAGTEVILSVPLNGGKTSSNTKYPRVEARELNTGGAGDSSTTKAAWDGSQDEHYLTAWFRVLKVPPNKPEVVVGQIHGPSDDTVKIKWAGTGSSGKLIATYGDNDLAVMASGLTVGNAYQYKIRAINGDVEFYLNNMSSPVVKKVDATLLTSGQYFKWGAYAQSNTTYDSVSSGPVIVSMWGVECWHTGYATPTTPGVAPVVDAGDDADAVTGATFTRTATESGSGITSRLWKIQSGPTTVFDASITGATVAWTPSIAGTYVLRYSATNSAGTGVDDVTVTVTSAGGGSGVPVVNAGADATILAGATLSRTAVENGSSITARRWSIEAGPAQVGTTLSTTASLSWTPPSAGTFVVRYSATNPAGTGVDDITVTVGTGGGSGGAPTFVGLSATASGQAVGVEIPAPAGAVAGDFELAIILSAGAETITAVPTGWVLRRQADVVSAAGDAGGPSTAWLYSATSPGTGASVLWTKSGTRVWHAVRVAYRGMSALGATAVTAESSASTAHTTPAVTPARSNSRVIGVACADYVNASAGPFTPPASWTERYDQTVTVSTENETITIADFTPGATSTTGTFTSAIADQLGLFAVVLEGPVSEQAMVLGGIAPTGGLGVPAVSLAGPAQTLTLPGIGPSSALGRFVMAVAPAPQTVQLRGIPPL